MEIKRHFHEQFEWDVVRCKVDKDFVGIASLQDIHMGSNGFRQRGFEKVVEFIFLNNILWIGNGDFPDNAQVNSVASPYDSTESPNNQLKYFKKTLEPIKHLCLGMLGGNHEDRTKKNADFDIAKELADDLGIEYYGYELYGVISREFDNKSTNSYTFYANHSRAGNKSPGLDANMIQRDWMQWNENIDIYMRGHTHHPYVMPVGSAVFDAHNTCVRQRTRWLYNAGSFHARPKTYAAKKPYGLQPNIYYTLQLDMRRHKKSVDSIKHDI